jgi:NAD-dependent SIR2 family protein deacetylase
MKCRKCHRQITKDSYMIAKIDGKYVPVHRDCGMCVSYHGPQHPKKPRCRVTKALKNYREEHENGR